MSCTIEKCLKYSKEHGGELPSVKQMNKIVHEQLAEFTTALSNAVIPENHDRFIMAAAFKLMYESRYNMLEEQDKRMCDALLKTVTVTSVEISV